MAREGTRAGMQQKTYGYAFLILGGAQLMVGFVGLWTDAPAVFILFGIVSIVAGWYNVKRASESPGAD